MRSAPLLFTVPNLLVAIALVVLVLPFVIGAWPTESKTHVRVYLFRSDESGSFDAYLSHSFEGEYHGMRDPQYPVAVVEIKESNTQFAPPRRGRRNHEGIVQVHSTDSFTIRLQDGENERPNGGVWDYPPLDQRTPKSIQPGSIADEALKDQPAEMRELLTDILDGIPNPGNEIESARRVPLINALQSSLRQDDFAWIADGVDKGVWSRGGVNVLGVVILVLGGAILIVVTQLLTQLFPGRDKARKSH